LQEHCGYTNECNVLYAFQRYRCCVEMLNVLQSILGA
jgi:hypothetical protein